MTKTFYDEVEILDYYRSIQDPTKEQIQTLIKYLDNDRYARYFFNGLENLSWAKPLHTRGYLSEAPAPLEFPEGSESYSMPLWYAGEYLKRIAGKFPEIVKELALNLETDNSRAIRTMLEAVILIPPELAAETVKSFKRWVKTPFVSFMMLSHEMGLIMERLAKSNQSDAALQVLEILAEPLEIKDFVDEEKIIAGTRHDFFWLKKAFLENLHPLIEIDPIGVVDVVEKQLVKSIDLEHDPNIADKDKPLNSFWRLNIRPDWGINDRRDFKNLLVNVLILSLEKACGEKKEEIPDLISRYISSDYSILRRIIYYLLRQWGEQYSNLLEKAYLLYIVKPLLAGESEFNRFIDSQYSNFPTYIQKVELGGVYILPDVNWMEGYIDKNPNQFKGDTKEEKRVNFIESWHLKGLNRFEQYLQGEDKEYYDRLLSKYEKPTLPPEERVVITSWEGPESPVDFDDIANKPVDEVIQILVDFIPDSEDSFWAPSREGLGRTFETDVQSRPGSYAEKALLLVNDKLHFVYHTHYFKGLETAIKNQEQLALADTITLCEFISSQEKDKFHKQELEPGLPDAKLAVANYFEELLRIKEPSLENVLLERIGQIIVSLLHQEDPFLENEGMEENSGDIDPRPLSTNFDYATMSLNSIRGMAMHCLVLYGLYCERKRKKEQGEDGKPVMVSLVKGALTETLDKSKFPSLTVHSVLGWYCPQLIYLDEEWVLENMGRIFPEDLDQIAYWLAAWSAYIRFSDVYTNVFPLLIPQYQRAVSILLLEPKKQEYDRLDERFTSHILKAYLLDMIDLESEDGLLVLYFENANDKTRSHGGFWLGQVMSEQQPGAKDRAWMKIWDLWQWRMKEALASENRGNYSKEITNYCRLLKYVPLELKELYPVLVKTLEFQAEGYELLLIIEYLAREDNLKTQPELAVSLLHEIVTSKRIFYLTTNTRNNVASIIGVAKVSDQPSKDKAINIINIFGERGDYEWRPFLEELN